MTGKARLMDLEFAGATIVRSRLMSLTLTGSATGGKSHLMSLTLTADAGSTPPATKKSHLMSLTLTGENTDLGAGLSIVPEAPYTAGDPIRPGQKFTLTAAASTGTPTSWSFSQQAGDPPCPGGLPGTAGTRYGVAPLSPPQPVINGSGVWTGDTAQTLTFSVTVSDGSLTDTATASIPLAPHLIWTRREADGVLVPLIRGGVLPTPGP